MTRTTTFRARLLRRDVQPQTITVRASSDAPPRTLRRAAGGGDQLTFDVYALVDADGWPNEATYSYVESVQRSAADADI
ncbi:hypothetical protein [Leifsonia poae]|jgi:hypothetical protein|uniref:Uncharacterized protein n=1 Tax=Leifsonia poae TaxID=110933 RepID=A0A9W6H9F2_9MICO|nr:hypothetical protein [Leifsonia poae]GLJ76001.1 hypothetical protein GCM10017584_15750 [Leifsonia poae]